MTLLFNSHDTSHWLKLSQMTDTSHWLELSHMTIHQERSQEMYMVDSQYLAIIQELCY